MHSTLVPAAMWGKGLQANRSTPNGEGGRKGPCQAARRIPSNVSVAVSAHTQPLCPHPANPSITSQARNPQYSNAQVRRRAARLWCPTQQSRASSQRHRAPAVSEAARRRAPAAPWSKPSAAAVSAAPGAARGRSHRSPKCRRQP
eukprot:358375-Chlamydomonas_euryale.AAC.5